MKKAIIISILITALAGGAFAQLTVSGGAYMGIQLRNLPGSDESTITTDHRSYGAPRVNLTATVTGGNFGARLVTRASGTEFSVRSIYGWADFFDNSLRFTAGQLADGQWGLKLDSDLDEMFLDTITGFRLNYHTPLQGLSVGTAFRATGNSFQDFIEEIIFGTTFVNQIFNMLFVYDLGMEARTLFGVIVPHFGFAGLNDLSAGFKIQAERLNSWHSRSEASDRSGLLRMYQRIGYRISVPVSVNVITGQRFFGHPDINGMQWLVGPGMTYNPTAFPSLRSSFRMLLDNYHYATADSSSPIPATPATDFGVMNLTLRPVIEKTLMGRAVLYVQYKLQFRDIISSRQTDRIIHTFGFGIEVRSF